MAGEKIRVGIIGANAHYGWNMRADLPALLAMPERASKSWGSGRQGLLLQLQIWIPALEHCSELLIQGFHPRLQ
jgi:hypothetical protein